MESRTKNRRDPKRRTSLAAGLAVSLTLALAAAAAPLAAQQATLGPGLADSLAALDAGEAMTVVVTFEGETVGEAQLDLLRSAGITRGVTYRELPTVGVSATRGQVEELAAASGVRSIWPNLRMEVQNEDATRLTGVDRVRSSDALWKLNGGMPVSGQGVGILINDTGVDGTMPDLEYGRTTVQNVLVPPDLSGDLEDLGLEGFQPVVFAEDQPNTDLNSGHGTHVAGIAAGSGESSGGAHEGVAPGADIIGVGSGATVALLNTLAGYDYMLTHQFEYGIRVMNNSWGPTGSAGYDPDDPTSVANEIAHGRGIVVCFSAGNAGPGSNTLNRYAVDPHTIGVAAGNDPGLLTGFSSRGIRGDAMVRPDVTAPGNLIVSVRASTGATLDALDAVDDATALSAEELPFYTIASGTSMSSPHVAGIVALMLEANPLLSPDEVKAILRETATEMPGFEPFQVGAGYVNAFAAVQKAFETKTAFGTPLGWPDNGHVVTEQSSELLRDRFAMGPTAPSNLVEFEVPAGVNLLSVEAEFAGFEAPFTGNLGNPLLVDVHSPDGERHIAFNTFFFFGPNRLEVVVNEPVAGTWTAEVKSFTPLGFDIGNLATLPDSVVRTVTTRSFDVSAVKDLEGHPVEGAMAFAISRGFFQVRHNEKFHPDKPIQRGSLARSFTGALSVRQFLPVDGSRSFGDVDDALLPFAEAVTVRGAALRDLEHDDPGVMEGRGGSFDPKGHVTRAELARSLVRGLGLDDEARVRMDEDIVVRTCGDIDGVPLEDQSEIPEGFRGYVAVVLELQIMNAHCDLQQGEFDLEPTITAEFRPDRQVTRAGAAIAETRFFRKFIAGG